MLHTKFLPPRWLRLFLARSEKAPRSTSPASAQARPPRRPRPVPGSEDYLLALTSCYLPESVWTTLEEGLRLAVRRRAYWGQTGLLWPDEWPGEIACWERFGVPGVPWRPSASEDITSWLVRELKRTVHTLEAAGLSRIERERRLAMHGARLGQLYTELGRRAPQRAPVAELGRALKALLV